MRETKNLKETWWISVGNKKGQDNAQKKKGEKNDRNKKGHQNVWVMNRNRLMLWIKVISRSLKVNENCVVIESKGHETTLTSTLN